MPVDAKGSRSALGLLPRWIRHPQNFSAGVTIVALSLFLLWATRDLGDMDGFYFGPGTAPRLFAGLLGGGGLLLIVMSLLVEGPRIESISLRGTVFVVAAVLFFAATAEPLGVVPSSFVTIIIASAGSPEFRPLESIIWSAVLTAFCSILLVRLLAVPLRLWPAL